MKIGFELLPISLLSFVGFLRLKLECASESPEDFFEQIPGPHDENLVLLVCIVQR